MHHTTGRTWLTIAGALIVASACSSERVSAPASPITAVGSPMANVVAATLDSVTPHTATIAAGATQKFTAWNTNGQAMAATEVTWSVNAGVTIDATGLFTAGGTAGTFTVSATGTANGAVVTASVTVTAAAGNGGGGGSGSGGTCKADDDKRTCESTDVEDKKGSNQGGDKKGKQKEHGG